MDRRTEHYQRPSFRPIRSISYPIQCLPDATLIRRQEQYAAMATQTQVGTALENAAAEMRRKMTLKYRIEL